MLSPATGAISLKGERLRVDRNPRSFEEAPEEAEGPRQRDAPGVRKARLCPEEAARAPPGLAWPGPKG